MFIRRGGVLTVGSLFSGIGGLDLGLERAGWNVRWQVEADPYRREQLSRHWPHVKRYGAVESITDLEHVTLVAGGFPCQPASHAGSHLGPLDDRWLWPEYARILRMVRPDYALVENVPGLLARFGGMGNVLGDLAALGFDAEWGVLSACAFGAPHTRDRLFILAYAHRLHGEVGLGAFRDRPWALSARDGATTPEHVWMEDAPSGDRLAHGPTDGVAVAAAGNAVVPQVAEAIGRMIASAHNQRAA